MLRKQRARYKVYLDRSRTYVGLVQFFVIIFMYLDKYDNTRIGEILDSSFVYKILFLFLAIFIMLVAGFIDKRFVREDESEELTKSNPIIMDIHQKVNDLWVDKQK